MVGIDGTAPSPDAPKAPTLLLRHIPIKFVQLTHRPLLYEPALFREGTNGRCLS